MIVLLGSYFLYKWVNNQEVLKIGGMEFRGKLRSAVVGRGLATFIVLYAGSTVAYLIGTTAIISVIHAVSHESMVDPEIEANSQMQMVGDIEETGGEQDTLLSPQ